jgi:hypothetical protein
VYHPNRNHRIIYQDFIHGIFFHVSCTPTGSWILPGSRFQTGKTAKSAFFLPVLKKWQEEQEKRRFFR